HTRWPRDWSSDVCSSDLTAIQQKKRVIERRSRIREFVFGIQDGLISTVGLLAGVQGATENNIVVIVTGLTAMSSGAISMAAGSRSEERRVGKMCGYGSSE